MVLVDWKPYHHVYNKVSSSDSELYRQNLEDEKSIPIGSAMTFWLENPNDTLQISFKVKKFYFYLEVYKEDTTKQLEDKTKEDSTIFKIESLKSTQSMFIFHHLM